MQSAETDPTRPPCGLASLIKHRYWEGETQGQAAGHIHGVCWRVTGRRSGEEAFRWLFLNSRYKVCAISFPEIAGAAAGLLGPAGRNGLWRPMAGESVGKELGDTYDENCPQPCLSSPVPAMS